MESLIPGSLVKRSGRSDEAAAAAIEELHTTVQDHNPADDTKTDRKHGIAIYSTRAALEAGFPDQILHTKWKPDNDDIQLTSNNDTEDSTAEETALLPADLTRFKTALSSPVDPGYARISGSTALSTNSRGTDEDVKVILSDWDRKYRRKNSGRTRHLHNPQDVDDEDVSSPGPATAPDNIIYNRKPSDSNSDDEYRRIFRRHNFSFNDPAPVKESDVHGDGIVLTPKEKRQRRPSRPSGFLDSKSILKDLKRPSDTQRAAPKRKPAQEEDAALYDAIAQRDMITRERRTRMQSVTAEPSSLSGYSQVAVESNSRLIRLGIRTASNGPPIWVKVPRSAPLEKMFKAALQSDDALRGYVFMLPGRYVHLNDTPDELGLIDNDCFEMHKLPKDWLPHARSIAIDDSAEVTSIDTPSVTRKASRKAEALNASNPIHFGETHNSKPNEARKPTKIAYDVELPKPINTEAFALEFDAQYSSSNSSATSNFSLPKLSPHDQAELLAILASDEESTPSHTSGSQHRYSPQLQQDPKPRSLDTFQEVRVPRSRSPSVISLHKTRKDVHSEDNLEPRDDAAILESLLLRYPPSEENAKHSKQREAQLEVIELEDFR